MMKTPFHEFCLRTGVLCQQCKQRISDGSLSEADLAISKYLASADFEDGDFKEAELMKSYEGKKSVLMKLRRGSLRRILPSIRNIEVGISRIIGKQALFFEENEGLRPLVQRLFYPAKIDSMSESWLPGGTSVTTVKLSGDVRRDPREISELLSVAYDRTINISA